LAATLGGQILAAILLAATSLATLFYIQYQLCGAPAIHFMVTAGWGRRPQL